MTCVICKQASPVSDTTTMTFSRGGSTIVIRDVPARVCPNCGEAYVDSHIARDLMAVAQRARQAGAQVALLTYPEAMACAAPAGA
jgi:YgiT-type zinc finger domain-containing protein